MRVKRFHDRGLTAAELIKFTPRYIKYRGEGYIHIVKAEQRKNKHGEHRIEAVTRTNILGETPRKHKQTIRLLGGGKRVGEAGQRLHVHCDCEFHTYTAEVALYRYGASDIVNSNGDFPYQTNPKGIPLLCKHLYTLIAKLAKRA